jgi:hypothetical protein
MLSFVYFMFYQPGGLKYCAFAIFATFMVALSIPPFGLINANEFNRKTLLSETLLKGGSSAPSEKASKED